MCEPRRQLFRDVIAVVGVGAGLQRATETWRCASAPGDEPRWEFCSELAMQVVSTAVALLLTLQMLLLSARWTSPVSSCLAEVPVRVWVRARRADSSGIGRVRKENFVAGRDIWPCRPRG